jgi:hypothetical protein
LLLVPDAAGHNPFAPPDVPVEVYCSHCGRVFESWQMVWLDDMELPGGGVWCCPTSGCDGIGFCFDVWPTDADFADAWREPALDLGQADYRVNDDYAVDPTDDTLDQSPADDRDSSAAPETGAMPPADDADSDDSADPRSAYLTRALIFELFKNNEDWYEFFHQHDARDPHADDDPPRDHNGK